MAESNSRNDITEKHSSARNQIDMTSGPILKKLLIFSIPIILSNMLQLAFNAADIIVVGRFGSSNALAAVGATSSFINLLITVFVGLSIGGNVLAARFIGAKDDEQLHKTVHTSMAISIVGGILMAVIGVLVCVPVMKLMNTPGEVLPLSVIYLRIFFIGLPASMLYNFGNSLLRAKGDTRRPLLFLAISGIVNVALNLLFVIVFKWDVAGVATATSISNYLSAVLMIICLTREQGAFRLYIKKIRFYRSTLLSIFKIGIPAGVQGSLFAISNIFIQASINSFGSTVMAGSAAASNLENFTFFGMDAFNQASVSFISQNVGAGKFDRIRPIMWKSLLCVSAVGCLLGIPTYVFGNTLVAIYDVRAAVIAEGVRRLAYLCLPYAVCGIMNTLAGIMRGLGHSLGPMIITIFGTCILRVIWIMLVLNMPALYSIENVYWSYPVTWIITTGMEALLLRHILKKEYSVQQ